MGGGQLAGVRSAGTCGNMALSYTTLVNVDAETAQKLAEFIGSKFSASESYVSDCKQLIDSAQTSALIAKLLEKQDILLDLESDNGMELYFGFVDFISFSIV